MNNHTSPILGREKTGIGQMLALLLFGTWTFLLFGLGVFLLGPHFTAQTSPALAGFGLTDQFAVHHFLSLQCGCSKKILAHLNQRKANTDFPETVHLIDAKDDVIAQLVASGFVVRGLTEDEAVQQYGLEILPQLIVVSEKKISYQGGYARDQMHAQVFEDQQIIIETRSGQAPTAHALFGCANGKLRKNLSDFLGVKYGQRL